MMRPAVLFAASLILASCATRSALPAEPIARPEPEAVDARLCAPLKSEPPVVGSIVQPVTVEESEAARQFLTGEAEGRAGGREGWARAEVAASGCRRLSETAKFERMDEAQ